MLKAGLNTFDFSPLKFKHMQHEEHVSICLFFGLKYPTFSMRDQPSSPSFHPKDDHTNEKFPPWFCLIQTSSWFLHPQFIATREKARFDQQSRVQSQKASKRCSAVMSTHVHTCPHMSTHVHTCPQQIAECRQDLSPRSSIGKLTRSHLQKAVASAVTR